MTPVTLALILVNIAAFALQGAFGDPMVATLALWPIGEFRDAELHATVGFHLWQLVTSAFLHANVPHLFLNMFALYMFGRDVERVLGAARFFGLYSAAVLTAALVQLLVVSSSATHEAYPTVGASGGVFGVLLAFGMLYPRRTVTLLIPPIPMPAWLFVTAYGLIELVNGVLGTQEGVAHFAHLGGMLGAYAVLRRWRRRENDMRGPT
jgi:membrane associated rhomboid family serine protease